MEKGAPHFLATMKKKQKRFSLYLKFISRRLFHCYCNVIVQYNGVRLRLTDFVNNHNMKYVFKSTLSF